MPEECKVLVCVEVRHLDGCDCCQWHCKMLNRFCGGKIKKRQIKKKVRDVIIWREKE